MNPRFPIWLWYRSTRFVTSRIHNHRRLKRLFETKVSLITKGKLAMKPVPIFLLQFGLLLPVVASGQLVTDGQGRRPLTDSNFTFFTSSQNTGRLALRGTETYFNLDPYNGEPSTQYEVRESPPELHFFINNKAEDPVEGSTYVGIEIIRLYTFEAISDRVNLYRNDGWMNSVGDSLSVARPSGPSLDEFVQDHSSDQLTRPYLVDWHAHPSGQAPSSWERRDAISDGLGLSANRNGYLRENQRLMAQGTYRLIRFSESDAPNARSPVRFTVNDHGARYLLINVFTPEEGSPDYQNQYRLEIVSR